MDDVPAAAGLFLALTTAPDVPTAERLARTLVEERLIACANLVPGVSSIFRWKGEVSAEAEVLLVMKTQRNRVPALKQRLPQLHPYEVPELIALPVTEVLEAYGAWVLGETTREER